NSKSNLEESIEDALNVQDPKESITKADTLVDSKHNTTEKTLPDNTEGVANEEEKTKPSDKKLPQFIPGEYMSLPREELMKVLDERNKILSSQGAGSSDGHNSQGTGSSDGHSSQGAGSSDGHNSQGAVSSDGHNSQGAGSSDGHSSQGAGSSDGHNSQGAGSSDGHNSQGAGSSDGHSEEPAFYNPDQTKTQDLDDKKKSLEEVVQNVQESLKAVVEEDLKNHYEKRKSDEEDNHIKDNTELVSGEDGRSIRGLSKDPTQQADPSKEGHSDNGVVESKQNTASKPQQQFVFKGETILSQRRQKKDQAELEAKGADANVGDAGRGSKDSTQANDNNKESPDKKDAVGNTKDDVNSKPSAEANEEEEEEEDDEDYEEVEPLRRTNNASKGATEDKQFQNDTTSKESAAAEKGNEKVEAVANMKEVTARIEEEKERKQLPAEGQANEERSKQDIEGASQQTENDEKNEEEDRKLQEEKERDIRLKLLKEERRRVEALDEEAKLLLERKKAIEKKMEEERWQKQQQIKKEEEKRVKEEERKRRAEEERRIQVEAEQRRKEEEKRERIKLEVEKRLKAIEDKKKEEERKEQERIKKENERQQKSLEDQRLKEEEKQKIIQEQEKKKKEQEDKLKEEMEIEATLKARLAAMSAAEQKNKQEGIKDNEIVNKSRVEPSKVLTDPQIQEKIFVAKSERAPSSKLNLMQNKFKKMKLKTAKKNRGKKLNKSKKGKKKKKKSYDISDIHLDQESCLSIPLREREPCGLYLAEDECHEDGCCFDEDSAPRIQCFYPPSEQVLKDDDFDDDEDEVKPRKRLGSKVKAPKAVDKKYETSTITKTIVAGEINPTHASTTTSQNTADMNGIKPPTAENTGTASVEVQGSGGSQQSLENTIRPQDQQGTTQEPSLKVTPVIPRNTDNKAKNEQVKEEISSQSSEEGVEPKVNDSGIQVPPPKLDETKTKKPEFDDLFHRQSTPSPTSAADTVVPLFAENVTETSRSKSFGILKSFWRCHEVLAENIVFYGQPVKGALGGMLGLVGLGQLFDDVCQDLANAPPMVLICTILVGTLGAAFLLCSCIINFNSKGEASGPSLRDILKTYEARISILEEERDGLERSNKEMQLKLELALENKHHADDGASTAKKSLEHVMLKIKQYEQEHQHLQAISSSNKEEIKASIEELEKKDEEFELLQEKVMVEEELDRLEKQGVITKVNQSDWASPVVVVPKSDGTIRLCGDYKVSINPVIDDEQYPLPTSQDLFAALAGSIVFTKLDLSHAYAQVQVDAESQQFLSINTHRGLYAYTKLPYGVKSVSKIFQAIMDKILQGIPKINADGIQPIQEKVNAIIQAPEPQDVSQLRSFLGMMQYYSRFITDLATTLAPLHELLRKDIPWRWSDKEKKAFNECKKALTSEAFLVHYVKRELRLACDASSYGLGAVISHVMDDGQERPIAFASRTLSTSERNYSQIEKEALAIIYGVKKFHQYIYGRKFTLVTDHQPLVAILGPKSPVPTLAAARMQRWALILSAHDYEIEYRKSADHVNADALSRLPLKGGNEAEENSIYKISVSSRWGSPSQGQRYCHSHTSRSGSKQSISLHNDWMATANMLLYFIQLKENIVKLEEGNVSFDEQIKALNNKVHDQRQEKDQRFYNGMCEREKGLLLMICYPRFEKLQQSLDDEALCNSQIQEQYEFKCNEVEVLQDCLLQIKGQESEDDDEEEEPLSGEEKDKVRSDRLKAMLDASKSKTEAKITREENVKFKNELEETKTIKVSLEEKIQNLEQELSQTKVNEGKAYLDFREKEIELTALRKYFKDTENDLHRKLTAEESAREATENKLKTELSKASADSQDLNTYKYET
ncbi:hypothetical protein QZH41_017508, partial [Actinostola sp. cb2023]